MRIALLCASPKPKRSASACLLADLGPLLAGAELVELRLNTPSVTPELLDALTGCDALVFAFPLYVDSLPSHLLSCLAALKMPLQESGRSQRVWAMCNCGFYEGRQAALALDILRHWCDRAGLRWGGGLGLGAAPALVQLSGVPFGKGPKRSFGAALTALAGQILTDTPAANGFYSLSMPRALYKWSGQQGWRKAARRAGLTPRDLGRRPEPQPEPQPVAGRPV